MKINIEDIASCVYLHEGVTYLWDNGKAIPIKEEEVEGFRKVHAPLFIFANGKIIRLI